VAADGGSAGDKRFHLAWFKSFGPPEWNGSWAGDGDPNWLDGESHVKFLQELERACFDFLMLEDSSMVSDIYGGTAEMSLKHAAYAPKGDPVPLASMLTEATEHIGVIATMSSTFYPPWLLARAISTLDHLSAGRVGWNCVTSSENRAAQNYGMDQLPPHDERYDRADEFVDLVKQLWDAWDADALVMDHASGVYVDHTKVRRLDYEGKYYRSRGPLNVTRSPQGFPVICQAGGSPRGRRFAATNADVLVALPKGLEAMKAYRDDIRRNVELAGRDPDACKVLYLVAPTLDVTHEGAVAKRAAMDSAVDARLEAQMVNWSGTMEIDFSQFDVDQPLPDEASTNGHQSTLSTFRDFANGRTLREAMAAYRTEALALVGSPETVADQMQEAMEFVGGDGFLIIGPMTKHYVSEITDGLVPELQRRGLTRTSYQHQMLRDHLQEF
jgi:FMN-dependent oxidoreductase (nitrilotriacetate monooxygenase family)